jgi:hypothetical protein
VTTKSSVKGLPEVETSITDVSGDDVRTRVTWSGEASEAPPRATNDIARSKGAHVIHGMIGVAAQSEDRQTGGKKICGCKEKDDRYQMWLRDSQSTRHSSYGIINHKLNPYRALRSRLWAQAVETPGTKI